MDGHGVSTIGVVSTHLGTSLSGRYTNTVTYTYDPATNKYLRSQGGSPHNAASGARLGGTNIVVMKVPVSRGGSTPEEDSRW